MVKQPMGLSPPRRPLPHVPLLKFLNFSLSSLLSPLCHSPPLFFPPFYHSHLLSLSVPVLLLLFLSLSPPPRRHWWRACWQACVEGGFYWSSVFSSSWGQWNPDVADAFKWQQPFMEREGERVYVLSSQHVCGCIKLHMTFYWSVMHLRIQMWFRMCWWRSSWSCLQTWRLKTISTQSSNFCPISDLIYIHIYMLENTNELVDRKQILHWIAENAPNDFYFDFSYLTDPLLI